MSTSVPHPALSFPETYLGRILVRQPLLLRYAAGSIHLIWAVPQRRKEEVFEDVVNAPTQPQARHKIIENFWYQTLEKASHGGLNKHQLHRFTEMLMIRFEKFGFLPLEIEAQVKPIEDDRPFMESWAAIQKRQRCLDRLTLRAVRKDFTFTPIG